MYSYATSTWDGVSADTNWYTQGSGAVYHIKTAADLAGLSKCFSQGYYMHGNFAGCTIYLDDDIDLNGFEWTPIGTIDAQNYYYEFAGAFDGQGHTVKGLNITKTNECPYSKAVGLFGYAPFSTTFSVKNLKVEGNITLSNPYDGNNSGVSLYAGGIIGYTGTEDAIEKCQSFVNIKITQNIGQFIKVNCGGIVGSIYNSNRTNLLSECYYNGDIQIDMNNSNDAYIGGIAGYVNCPNATIDQCASDARIAVGNGNQMIGGIVGGINVKNIENAIFSGSINSKYPSYGLVGGIGCMNLGPVKYENCLATGSISKEYGTGWLSAISGTQGGGESITNCYYLSGLPNTSAYGTPISESDLKSGNVINGFDTDIWCFQMGTFPYLGFTKPTYTLNLALEGGYVGIRLNEGATQKFILSQDGDSELYQVLWNGEDISDDVDAGGNLTTPEIYENSVLTVIYRSLNGIERSVDEKETSFYINGSTLNIKNPQGIQDLQIYNKSGVLIQKATNIGVNAIIDDLTHDIYIIKVNKESFKIIL